MKSFVFFLMMAAAGMANAGICELSGSYNFEKTHYDPNHSTAKQSVTGSLGYYFWEMTAIEFSYTQGEENQIQPEYNAYQVFRAYGSGLLLTMANKDSAFKPYLKVGGAYIVKDATIYIRNFPEQRAHAEGLAPTAGVGFKYMVNSRFAFKGGFNVQTSPLNQDDTTYDMEAVFGLSFLF